MARVSRTQETQPDPLDLPDVFVCGFSTALDVEISASAGLLCRCSRHDKVAATRAHEQKKERYRDQPNTAGPFWIDRSANSSHDRYQSIFVAPANLAEQKRSRRRKITGGSQ